MPTPRRCIVKHRYRNCSSAVSDDGVASFEVIDAGDIGRIAAAAETIAPLAARFAPTVVSPSSKGDSSVEGVSTTATAHGVITDMVMVSVPAPPESWSSVLPLTRVSLPLSPLRKQRCRSCWSCHCQHHRRWLKWQGATGQGDLVVALVAVDAAVGDHTIDAEDVTLEPPAMVDVAIVAPATVMWSTPLLPFSSTLLKAPGFQWCQSHRHHGE